MLPNNVLLEIFNFYRNNHPVDSQWWILLVHVCQIWRRVIFDSPHRLNLQIHCTHGTPVKEHLGIWPAFPIAIDYYRVKSSSPSQDDDNIIAALEHPDRVCLFKLQKRNKLGWDFESIITAMQEPFPVLTYLDISTGIYHFPVLPADFLGGSAPRLQEITLSGIPYPALPALLLSATDLVKLDLFDIPTTGYISPEAMVASLATLPKLETFIMGFRLATPRPDQIHPPPLTRTVLPALTYFRFKGASEYLEDLVSRVDSPRLNQIVTAYLNQVVDFQVLQFSNFVDRTVGPEITLFKHARFTFSYGSVAFTMIPHANYSPWDRRPATTIVSCRGIDSQVSHMAQVLGHMSAKLSNVVHLKLKVEPEGLQLDGTDGVEWAHLLHQFSSAKTLHISQEIAGHVALALEDITTAEMVDEVLPSLDLIRVVGQPASSVKKFTATRQLSGHPVTVIETETEFDERLESYVSEQENAGRCTYFTAYRITVQLVLTIHLPHLGDTATHTHLFIDSQHESFILKFSRTIRTNMWNCGSNDRLTVVGHEQGLESTNAILKMKEIC